MKAFLRMVGPARRIVPSVCRIVCIVAVFCRCLAETTQAAEAGGEAVAPPAGIWGLEFSPDGQWLAAATNSRGHGGPIVIWRVKDWKPHVVRFEPMGGMHVAFSPDGKRLAYSTRSSHVGLIDVASGELTCSISALDDEKGTVFCVTFTPDGRSLLTSGNDRAIRQWKLEDASLMRIFEGHNDCVDGIAVSPDGSLLLSGCNDSQTRLWSMRTGKVLQLFEPGENIVRRVRFSPDGRYFLASQWDGKTRIRETKTRHLRAVLGGSSSAAMTRDNRLAAVTRWGVTASVYRLQLEPVTPDQARRIHALIRQLDDDDYATREAASDAIAKIGMAAEPLLSKATKAASTEVRIRARELRKRVLSPEPIARLEGHRGELEVVCFSPDDKLLASGCRGGDVKVWSAPDFREIITLTAPPAE